MLTPKLFIKLLPFYLLMAAVFSWPLVSLSMAQADAKTANKQYLENTSTNEEPAISGQPMRLEIPRLGINLPVEHGGVNPTTGEWILGWKAAYFSSHSVQPNNKSGHTLIYGHDVTDVFTPTKNLVAGDQLIITTSNNYRLEYYFASAVDVKPSDTSILARQTDQPEITLLTCRGSFNQLRRLMTFKYLRAQQ